MNARGEDATFIFPFYWRRKFNGFYFFSFLSLSLSIYQPPFLLPREMKYSVISTAKRTWLFFSSADSRRYVTERREILKSHIYSRTCTETRETPVVNRAGGRYAIHVHAYRRYPMYYDEEINAATA